MRPRSAPSLLGLQLNYLNNREQSSEVIRLAETSLRDCLPALDVGNAFSTLDTPALSRRFWDEESPHESAWADVERGRNT